MFSHYFRLLLILFHLLIFLISSLLEQNFSLDERKSELLANLFIKRNLSLKFEFIQKDETEYFYIYKRNAIIIEFMVDGNERVKRLEIGCSSLKDYFNFHNLFENLNDQLSYILQAKKLITKIGGKYNEEEQFPIFLLREFSADIAMPIENLCLKLRMLSERGDVTKEIEHDLMNNKKQLTQDFNIQLARFEKRINRLEKYQRGCPVSDSNGRTTVIPSGSRIQNHTECSECQCDYEGNLYCKPIGCPALNCKHPIKTVHGQCCPSCGKRCLFNGHFYDNGEHFSPKTCTYCFCSDGRVECSFKFPMHCPQLDCPNQETLPGECCPVCVNVDHCLNNTLCSLNAICKSGKYSSTCQCKEGFFGDGHECYDIDECLINYNEHNQIRDGCGLGTFCINLPGSFICKCLPGFTKILDDKTDNGRKSCIDSI
ncbi:VWFC domain-containing protein [Meloidogyne graminicola]|uniref:VWFC domain-containing protein n=1 Tax=Meloidogyne graminicola TaxID=189291 RepID=A0A8S9ZJ85_9BILA|nr:VWFC domain-containing protein [Meloidogyne graminicola]